MPDVHTDTSADVAVDDTTAPTEATLHYGDTDLTLPRIAATEGNDAVDVSKLFEHDRPGHPRRRVRQHRVVPVGHHLHRRRPGHPALPRLPDRPAGPGLDLPRGELPADLRRAADAGRAGDVHGQDPAAHAAARGPEELLQRLPARRAPDARAVQCGERAVHLLPGQPQPVRPRPGRAVDGAPAGQAAHHRGVRVQEEHRPAVPLPGQLAGPGRELPGHDVRPAGRALRAAPGPGQGARPALHPARRPRAELLDRDRPGRRARARPTCSPRSRPASTPSPARCTAAPTRPCSRCWSRSRPTAATSARSSSG